MPSTPRAFVFDAYGTLYDVHSVVALAEQLAPRQGAVLSQV
jgi:2-haloacid dehalogenase